MLPAAHAILWFMAAFLVLWAASLVWRGVVRGAGGLRCPACRKAVAQAKACGNCGFSSDRARDFRRARLHWGLIGTAAGTAVAAVAAAYLGFWVQSWSEESLWEGEAPGFGAWQAAALGVAAFGLVLAVWSWRGDRSRGRKRCPKCWYDMSGGGLKCPECGHEPAAVKQLYRPRRRRFATVIGLLILVSSYGVWVTPRVAAGGWVAAVPTTVLIAGLSRLPDSVIFDDGTRDEDWTLRGRYVDRNWDWQDSWLEWRCRRILRGKPSPRVLARALAFTTWDPDEPADRALSERVHRHILDLLSAPTDEFRAHAERLFVPELWHPMPERALQELVTPYVPMLTKGLLDRHLDVRSWCSSYLVSAGDAAAEAIPAFIEAIRVPARSLPIGVAVDLKQLCRKSPRARDAVVASLHDENPVVLQMLTFALSYPEQDRAVVTDEFLRLLEHPNDQVALYAATGLVRLGIDPHRTIPAMIRQARSDRTTRHLIAWHVGGFGDRAGPWLADVIELLSAPDEATRFGAALAIVDLARESTLDLRPALPALRGLMGPQSTARESKAASEAIGLIELKHPLMGPSP